MGFRSALRLGWAVTILAFAALGASAKYALRRHPCAGEPVPVKNEELAAHVSELRVVARPWSADSDDDGPGRACHGEDHGVASGASRYSLGPLELLEGWQFNCYHGGGMGPPFVVAMLRPASDDAPLGGPPWDVPLFSGDDREQLASNIELRQGAAEDWLLMVMPQPSLPLPVEPTRVAERATLPPAWQEYAVAIESAAPLPSSGPPRTSIAFHVERHQGGHRGHLPWWFGAAVTMLIGASAVLVLARRHARALGWRQGTLDAEGFIVSDGAPEPGEARGERFPTSDAVRHGLEPGQPVLFEAAPRMIGYRTSAASPAVLRVVPQSRQSLRSSVQTLLLLATTTAIAVGVLATQVH